MNPHTHRILQLRQTMQQHQLDAWIVPTADPHLSEYLPEHWQTRQWLSGFNGSAGTLVITQSHAGLWTDSRYWEQATAQLNGSGIILHKLVEETNYPEWLTQHLPEHAQVGIAPDMLSYTAKQHLKQQFAHAHIHLIHTTDITDNIRTDRPPLPTSKIYIHPIPFATETVSSKLSRIHQALQSNEAQYHLISSLDDIAWITNLRGSDVPHNPVFLSHLLLAPKQTTLFVDKNKLTDAALTQLQDAGINTADYQSIGTALSQINGTLQIDPAKTAISTLQHLNQHTQIIHHPHPSTLFKSQKTPQEIQHIRQAMIQDGIALCGFFAEFEQLINNGGKPTELDVDTLLTVHRSRQQHYISPSFDTIAGYNANGALPHYRATAQSHSTISGNGLLLIDSGAQYLNGTTDITRVVPIGTPTSEHKRDFTLVLKAHIALATAVFPENLPAPMLDGLCRQSMWQAQCDYGHGTGHGVGFFLNVHEGPQSIAYRATPNPHHAMKIGMVTSNEPGLYRTGKWGIRIENLVVNQPVANPKETEFGTFLCLETLTLCPIDTRLIEIAMLTEAERTWLNQYHNQVRNALQNHTEGIAHDWLMERTDPI